MAFDKNIFKRFNVDVNIKKAQEMFINKVNNILFYSEDFYNDAFSFNSDKDIAFKFCNKYGLQYQEDYLFEDDYLLTQDFTEYILRLNCLLDILKEYETQLETLIEVIQEALEESPVDLNLKININKNSVSLYPSGSKLLDEKLIDETLGVFTDEVTNCIKIAFEKGLREFLEAKKDKSKLKNVIRDMQLSLDELSKLILQDKNVGLKHLLKNENWKKTGLNDYYKKIYFSYNEMIDKLAKHKSDTVFEREEVESIIYMTGLFIRLCINKIQSEK